MTSNSLKHHHLYQITVEFAHELAYFAPSYLGMFVRSISWNRVKHLKSIDRRLLVYPEHTPKGSKRAFQLIDLTRHRFLAMDTFVHRQPGDRGI